METKEGRVRKGASWEIPQQFRPQRLVNSLTTCDSGFNMSAPDGKITKKIVERGLNLVNLPDHRLWYIP